MMQTFGEYARSFRIPCDPGMLDFSLEKDEYCIYDGSKPLQTPGGNVLKNSSEDFIRQVITDLQLSDGTDREELSSPLLYSFYRDILATGEDPFAGQWKELLVADPFVLTKTSEKSLMRPFNSDEHLVSFSFVSLSGLIGTVNRFAGRVLGEINLEESELNPFPEILWLFYQRLSGFQKVAVQALSGAHEAGIVLPLLLVSGDINPVEYVKGLISLRIRNLGQFTGILSATARVRTFLDMLTGKPLIYKHLGELIAEGEGDSIEFKSTLRWDIRAGKTNPAIEHACLKTISAFLNSSGGTLLIGVRDDGSIEGVESDKFFNDDKFLLHLWTLIRTCLGRDFTPFIRTRLEKADEKTVCIVSCLPSNRPVFLRQPGYPEEIYIRMGPSSNAMDISEALKYINNHFE